MKKHHLFLTALAGFFLAGCTNDELPDSFDPTSENAIGQAIGFGSEAPNLTRSTADDITKLAGQFLVYGTKTVDGTNQTVFNSYKVWNKAAGATDNTTNRYGWEYVGTRGTSGLGEGNIELNKDQTIKYWDRSATAYHFVAGSPVDAFTFTANAANVITGASISGIKAHVSAQYVTDAEGVKNPVKVTPIGAVYVADPLIINPDGQTGGVNNYESAVNFSFTGQQALVRVGLYETIPGYHVTAINFYPYDIANGTWSTTAAPYHNVILNSLTSGNYFTGGTLNATLTYTWGETPSYTFAYSAASGTSTITTNNWYGGSFYLSESNPLLTTSSSNNIASLFGTDKEMRENGYFPVLPTASGATNSALVLKCDFTLTSDDNSGETIEVKDATAAIPAAFSQWEQNHAYTYLFKISDKTAGSQGVLYPIQFDAAIVAGLINRNGFITTVSVPSITSYQFASPYTTIGIDDKVEEVGIKYVTGTPIYVTVQDNSEGTLKALSAMTVGSEGVGNIKVYYLGETEMTESDLQVNRPTEHATVRPATNIPSTAWSLHSKTISSPNYMTFTANHAGYYAVEYVNTADPLSFAYKVLKVETAASN
mgnify:CR=1 FL=1